MLKKSLIASVLAIATFGAYAQAPVTTASTVSQGSAAPQATPANGSKVRRDALRKKLIEERNARRRAEKAKLDAAKARHDEMMAKHETEKAKRDEVKAAHAKEKAANAAKKIAPEVPAKQ